MLVWVVVYLLLFTSSAGWGFAQDCNILATLPTSQLGTPYRLIFIEFPHGQADHAGCVVYLWTGWTPDGTSSWCCAASGVSCDINNRVTALSLPSRGLSGSLSFLSNLTMLTNVDVTSNTFTGNLSAIAGLIRLQVLRAPYNRLSGDLSPLVALTNLLLIDLRSNLNLIGNLTPLAQCTQIIVLALASNFLSGVLNALAKMTSLSQLLLDANQFTGL